MLEITQELTRIEGGDPAAAEHLLPLVYEELRNWQLLGWPKKNPDQRGKRPRWRTRRI